MLPIHSVPKVAVDIEFTSNGIWLENKKFNVIKFITLTELKRDNFFADFIREIKSNIF